MTLSRSKWIVLLCLLALICAAISGPASGELVALVAPLLLFVLTLAAAIHCTLPDWFIAPQSILLPVRAPRPPPVA